MRTTRPILPAPAEPITTPRLLLRPFHQSDLADFHLLRTQANVMVWTTSGKIDVDQDATQTWMDRFLPPNDATTFCLSIEELKEPGRVIGSIGCHDSEPLPEVGYMFRTEFWGKGYATEAMEYWLQAWWKLPRKDIEVKLDPYEVESTAVVPEVLKADVVVTNHASKRILERFGFITVREEMVDDHAVQGEKIKLITLELQRPQ